MRTSTCLLIATLACAGDGAAPETSDAPAEPPDTGALVELALEALRAEPRAFTLTERAGDEVVRSGELLLASAGPESPRFRISLDGASPVELASDGDSLFVRKPGGEVIASRWDRAGIPLFSQEGGKLLPTVLNPSSFASYGGEVSASEDGDAWVLRTGLPNGGFWLLTVDRVSGLPRSLALAAGAEAVPEVIELEPRAGEVPADSGTYRLEPGGGGEPTEYFAGPAPGEPAPEVSFELADGTRTSLSELRGSPVVLDFWATWCVPCRPAMKELESLYQEHAAEGLRVFGLRLFDYGDPEAFLAEVDVSYPIGKGEPFAEPYAIDTYGLPTLYVVDRDGAIVDLVVGFKPGVTEEKIEAAVLRALE